MTEARLLRPVFTLVLLAALVTWWPTPAAAAPAASPSPSPAPMSETCMGCHSDKFESPDHKVVMSADSPHAALDCVGCHADAATIPHEAKPAPVDCSMCHSEAGEAYARSIHKEKSKTDALAAGCKDCHGTHDIRRVKDPASKVYPLNLPATCGACHNSTRMGIRKGVKVKNAVEAYTDSIHGRGLLKGGLLVSASCNDCHGSHEILRASNPASKLSRQNTPETCGVCHKGVLDEYRLGTHGQKWAEGNPVVPICTTCHSSHSIQEGEAAGFQLKAIGGCGSCHAKQIETYRETYHGQVTALGFVAVAKCADCHGQHDVRPSSDPASSTNPKNLRQTCGQCHEQVNSNFTQFLAHGDPHDRARFPVLYWTYLFMSSLLTGTFIFFGIHTALWFIRSLRDRRQGHAGGSAEGNHGRDQEESR